MVFLPEVPLWTLGSLEPKWFRGPAMAVNRLGERIGGRISIPKLDCGTTQIHNKMRAGWVRKRKPRGQPFLLSLGMVGGVEAEGAMGPLGQKHIGPRKHLSKENL